jgi:glycosyltransferase involved in cell wall biosynthesis
VVLEAMCAARPVVATRVGGIPEVLRDGETGHLVEPRRPDLLADVLGAVLGQPLVLRALGRAGRRRVEAEYSLERMTDAVQSIYAGLAA